jgi:hypothetical protein
MRWLDQARHAARAKHFSSQTEQAHVYGVERYIRQHGIPTPWGRPRSKARMIDPVEVLGAALTRTPVGRQAFSAEETACSSRLRWTWKKEGKSSPVRGARS